MAIYKLNEIFKISSGSTPSTSKHELWRGELPWYTPIDLRNNTHTIRKIKKNITPVVPPQTVLLSCRAPIGYVGIAKETSWHSQGIKGFKNDEKIILNKFFYFWLLKNVNKFVSLGAGSTFLEVSKTSIENFLIDLTLTKIEQQQIIDIIEQKESLFLKNINCVRIDLVENCKKDMHSLIDIIEPIERFLNELNSIILKVELFVKNLKSEPNYKFGNFVKKIKNKPKNIVQVSAKILGNRTSLIDGVELPLTYKTNNFFAPKGTIVINTIRTYLEKFGILYCDADANGTLAMLEPIYFTSALHNLLNDEFWKQANSFSQGTKMPVLKVSDLLNIVSKKTYVEIPNLLNFFLVASELKMKMNNLKEKMIRILIV